MRFHIYSKLLNYLFGALLTIMKGTISDTHLLKLLLLICILSRISASPDPNNLSGNSSSAKSNKGPTSITNAASTNITYLHSQCITPAIEQFPKPIIGPVARKQGALIIHLLIAVYTFVGLAIVCDEYFVLSLDRLCKELRISPDVAGATFMAAGSSAPELATVVIGVFFAKDDDIGISGVIGSAVFNIMFVVSLCAFFATTVLELNWWPLIRDCFFYSLSILLMLITIYDEEIDWTESMLMLALYATYCIVLFYNEDLHNWILLRMWKAPQNTIKEDSSNSYNLDCDDVRYQHLVDKDSKMCQPENSLNDQAVAGSATHDTCNDGIQDQFRHPMLPADNVLNNSIQHRINSLINSVEIASNDESIRDHLIKPNDVGMYGMIRWIMLYPIYYCCEKTIPNCRMEIHRNKYPFTFIISMLWIAFYSYIMVWMITIIGILILYTHIYTCSTFTAYSTNLTLNMLRMNLVLFNSGSTCGIPDTVMGLTFVAAGVSVPDALSSIAVIKDGRGDMAISNAVGSNVFDILICLGLPWFIRTAITKPGSQIRVISKGLTYSTVSLLSTVIFLILAIHFNDWKLNKKVGAVLMVWYIAFIILASMYELNLFGYLNPPECTTTY